jgi:hypothetical protein
MRIAYTLFEIANATQLSFRYRLLKVRELLPDDPRQPIRLQRWADELWRRRLHCPVFPTRVGKDAFFMIPADVSTAGVDLSYVDVPSVTYHADVTDQFREIELPKATQRELELLAKMLERPLSDTLARSKDEYWQDTWTRFFHQTPANANCNHDTISAYRGITFSVVPIPPRNIYLALDVVSRYVGRNSLASYRANHRESELFDHCEAPFDKRKWFLRDNGTVKHRCIYAGDTGKSIAELRIEDLGQTVLEYYQERFPGIARNLDPNDPAVFCARDKKDEDHPVPAPASLLFPIFPFERGFSARCATSPQLSPDERQTSLRAFLRTLPPITYANTALQISDRLLTAEDSYFPLPSLEFGQGLTVHAHDLPRTDGEYTINAWGAAKTRALMQVGPYFQEEFPATILLYPTGLDRRIRERFTQAVERELTIYTGTSAVNVTKQIAYSPDPDGHDLLLRTNELKREHGEHALLLCILSDCFEDYVHNRFKAECNDLYSQCVMQQNVVEVTIRGAKRRNLALGIMMALGFKPWVLSSPLHADVHIGIDVLRDQVAYTYLYGPNGREIFRDRGDSGGEEVIKTRLLREKLISGLTRIRSTGAAVNCFVVHRDGKWWPKETDALEEAVRFLQAPERNTLPRDVRYAVAEIRKSHFPIRVLTVKYRDRKPVFQNPFPGCYIVLDRNRAVLASTGKPSEWDEKKRTASTILVQLAHNPSNMSIEDITRDAFYLTQLNWSAPEIEINAPVTIRWADDLLRDLYIEPER